jgi:hypothetical protein
MDVFFISANMVLDVWHKFNEKVEGCRKERKTYDRIGTLFF